MSGLTDALNSRKSHQERAVLITDPQHDLLVVAEAGHAGAGADKTQQRGRRPTAIQQTIALNPARPLRDLRPGELGTDPAGDMEEYTKEGLRALLGRVDKGVEFALARLDQDDDDTHMGLALLCDLMQHADESLVAHITHQILHRGART